MEISGTLTPHGVTRLTVLLATYNGGYKRHAEHGSAGSGGIFRTWLVQALRFWHHLWRACSGYVTMGAGDLIDFSIEAEFTGPAAGNAGRSDALRGFPRKSPI